MIIHEVDVATLGDSSAEALQHLKFIYIVFCNLVSDMDYPLLLVLLEDGELADYTCVARGVFMSHGRLPYDSSLTLPVEERG